MVPPQLSNHIQGDFFIHQARKIQRVPLWLPYKQNGVDPCAEAPPYALSPYGIFPESHLDSQARH